MKFNPALHGLRACAALAVLLFHCNTYFPELSQAMNFSAFGVEWIFAYWPWSGWMGVPLFFILSGYLLGGQLATKPLTKKTILLFWKRRFLRIYPAYWLQLCVLFIVGYLTGLHFKIDNWQGGLQHLILWLNMPPTWVRPMNGVWWTLPIELSFYLFLPFIIWMKRKIGILAVFLISAVLMFGWRGFLIQQNPGINLSSLLYLFDALPGTLATFVAGISLAFIPDSSTLIRKVVLIFAITALYYWTHFFAAHGSTYWTGGSLLIYANLIVTVIIAAIVYACLDNYALIGFLSSKLFVWLGQISYGIYLWHFPVILLLKSYWPVDWVGGYFGFLAFLICLLISCACASLSFYLVEQPMMNWRRSKPNPIPTINPKTFK